MTPRPTPESFAEAIYAYVGPMASSDEINDWALLVYSIALGIAYQDIDDLVRDRTEYPGWSVLLDVDACPLFALPWLAQVVGVELPSSLSEQQQRDLIVDTANWKRGRFAAMVGAVQPFLTGHKTVAFRERYDPSNPSVDSPYWLTVRTYDSETPDPETVLNALLSAKPAGIILDYDSLAGQDWQTVKDNYATWQAVKDHYTAWQNVVADTP